MDKPFSIPFIMVYCIADALRGYCFERYSRAQPSGERSGELYLSQNLLFPVSLGVGVAKRCDSVVIWDQRDISILKTKITQTLNSHLTIHLRIKTYLQTISS